MKYIAGVSADTHFPEGDYPFIVKSSKPKTSKKGSEMIELILEVNNNGLSIQVTDYLVFDGAVFTSARIDQFRTAIGEVILAGEEVDVLPSELLSKNGTAHLVVEEWNGKKRNKIGSYLEPDNIPLPLEVETTPAKKASKKTQNLY